MRTPRIVLALIAVCLAAPAAAAAAPSAALSPVESGARVVVRVEIANPGAEPIRVLRRAVGAGPLADPAFSVTRDGEPVDYVGALAKHGPPVDADYLTVPARGAASLDVELSGAYAFTRTGTYAIRLVATDPALILDADGGVVATALRSEALTIAADAQPYPVPAPVRPSAMRSIGTLSLSFTNCSAVPGSGDGVASEQAVVAQAVADAIAYADASSAYFEDRRAGSRYVEWFGVYAAPRWAKVRDAYATALAALETQSIVVECHSSGCSSGVYAFVYPNQPYRMHVCNAFWTAPSTGTDSRAGTLIHEIMHFRVVADTDDHVYGQGNARTLAQTNPADAVDNSDNYEYFAENTPVTADNAPAVVVDTPQQGLGERTVGTTMTGTAITVRNSGDAAMTIGALTVAAPFSIDQDACSSRILAAGMSCTFAVAFAPQEAGAASGSVVIPTDARVAADAIAVTGTGVAVPAPAPAPVATNAPAPAAATPAAVRARAVRGGIRVVLPTGTRSFRLEVRRGGRWVPAGLYRAPTGTRTVQVKRGSYRVIVTGATPVAVRV